MKKIFELLLSRIKQALLRRSYYFDGEVRSLTDFSVVNKELLPILIVSRKQCFETHKVYKIANLKDLKNAISYDAESISPYSDYLCIYRLVQRKNDAFVIFWFISKEILPLKKQLLTVVPESLLAYSESVTKASLVKSNGYNLYSKLDSSGDYNSHWKMERVTLESTERFTQFIGSYDEFVWEGLSQLLRHKVTGLVPFLNDFLERLFNKLSVKSVAAPALIILCYLLIQSGYLVFMESKVDRYRNDVAEATSKFLNDKATYENQLTTYNRLLSIGEGHIPISNRLHFLQKGMEGVGDIHITNIRNIDNAMYVTAKADSATQVLSKLLESGEFESVGFSQGIRSEGQVNIKQVFTLEIHFKS